MGKEGVPLFPFSRLLLCSGFGDYFGRVKDAASKNIQGVIYLGSGFMWNDIGVCGGTMGLKIMTRD